MGEKKRGSKRRHKEEMGQGTGRQREREGKKEPTSDVLSFRLRVPSIHVYDSVYDLRYNR
jgi:hypothetical protein